MRLSGRISIVVLAAFAAFAAAAASGLVVALGPGVSAFEGKAAELGAGAAMAPLARQLRGLVRYAFAVALGAGLGVSGLLVLALDRLVSGPLAALHGIVSSAGLDSGPLLAPGLSARKDEIGKLARALGGLFERLAESRKDLLAVNEELEARTQERLHRLAYYDPLTGMPNRTLFKDRLASCIARSQRHGRRMALLFLDLDRFKYINDTMGHAAGDSLLVEVARRLKRRVRESDTVCRIGGDEFTLILDQITKSEDAGMVCQGVLEELSRPVLVQGKEVFIGASIGIAIFPYDDTSPEGLTRMADAAMYKAKEYGRNTYRYVSGGTEAFNRGRLELEVELRRAVEREEFVLYFQPLERMDGSGIAGAEALIRWRRPGEGGPVLPSRFIGLAEENGLILAIGAWVLREACSKAAGWLAEGLEIGVSINISGRQFERAALPGQVRAALESSGLPPRLLTIELTETIVMSDVDSALRAMRELKEIGVSLAIDDFGTGYSSLSYLSRFPIDRLKIDQSFVRALGTEPEAAVIVDAVISMAKALGLETVAEGIELDGQRLFLAERGCHEAQGFLYSPALPEEEFLAYARAAPARVRA